MTHSKKWNPKALASGILALALVVSALFAGTVPVFSAADAVEITVVHTNDVHARVDVEPYVSQLVKDKKQAGEHVLLLSAGDVLHGQPLATLSRGRSIIEIMNATGYDAMVPGNHDFNYGAIRLQALESRADFPILAANVTNKIGGADAFTPYITKTFDGVKVGIFGLATPETATKTNPNNVRSLSFNFPLSVAKQMVRTLQNEGCDVIIALSHLGDDEETWPEERSTALAAIKGIDLIVDGHSHTTLEQGKVVDNTLLVQTGSQGENIGVVKLTVQDGRVVKRGAQLLPVPVQDEDTPAEQEASALQPDKAVVDLIASINKQNEALTAEVVAESPVRLEGERELVRTQETNLGNLIADAMLDASGADVSFTNGGGIRASIEAGAITKGDVLTVLPFGNYIVTKTVTGEQLVAALEAGLTAYPETAGSFPQIGGMQVVFDPAASPGKRVVSVTLRDGEDLEPNETYVVATNDFLAAGGDGYTMFGEASGTMSYASVDDALIEYLGTLSQIPATPDGRLVTVSESAQQAA